MQRIGELVQRVGGTTDNCNSNEVARRRQRLDAAPMRCGDAMAMQPHRRRCNRTETGAKTGAYSIRYV